MRLALDPSTAERARQERLGSNPDAGRPAVRVYADGALIVVAKMVARGFRQ